jgi:hypothetical protein
MSLLGQTEKGACRSAVGTAVADRPPPAQIYAGGIAAHGSHLGCVTAKPLFATSRMRPRPVTWLPGSVWFTPYEAVINVERLQRNEDQLSV